MTRVSRREEDLRFGAAGGDTRRAELSEAGRAELWSAGLGGLGERRLGFLEEAGLEGRFFGMRIG